MVVEKIESLPKINKSNSLIVFDMTFYIKKVLTSYVAWDIGTGYKIVATDNKTRLAEYLFDNYDEIKKRIQML